MRSHNPSLLVAGYVFALLSFIQPLCSSAQDLEAALAHAKNVYAQQGPKAALPEYESLLAGYPKAHELLETALQIKRELHDQREEGKTLSHLGLLYWDQGKYPEAVASFNESLSIARELHDAQLEGASLNNLGMVYDEQGDYRGSLAH